MKKIFFFVVFFLSIFLLAKQIAYAQVCGAGGEGQCKQTTSGPNVSSACGNGYAPVGGIPTCTEDNMSCCKKTPVAPACTSIEGVCDQGIEGTSSNKCNNGYDYVVGLCEGGKTCCKKTPVAPACTSIESGVCDQWIEGTTSGCKNGYVHVNGLCGTKNICCKPKATDCQNGTDNPGSCSIPGSQSECCEGYICTYNPGGMLNGAGGNICGSGENSNKESPPPPPCASKSGDGKCLYVNTGFGTIGTDPQGLIQSLFGIVLSVSGGIALLLIILSGYRMLASQGNPEALKGAKEQLTAAIVGLLFIIFALVILQIIGVDVLQIPGFSSGHGAGGTWQTPAPTPEAWRGK